MNRAVPELSKVPTVGHAALRAKAGNFFFIPFVSMAKCPKEAYLYD